MKRRSLFGFATLPQAALAVIPSGINVTDNCNMTLVSGPDSNETLKNPLVAVQQLAV
jgi:hypothetical protein